MDFTNINFDLPKNQSASIKVIGVGGGGSNAVNYMFQQGITGVDFVVANTDNQALNNSPVPRKIQLGASITEGLGAGANPEVGEQAALESMDDIKNVLDAHTKMVFITAGMGGGTGTGAAPVIASIAKEMGILTVGICTAPFFFEGKMRVEQAKVGIEKFRNNVDSLIIINNDKLRELYGNLSYKTGFAKADEVLATAAKGIAEVITHHYSTNIDLRDAKTVLADSGTAIMGSAKANGENKARKAIEAALDSPLLNDNKISGAKNVLLLIVSGNDEVTMDEIGIINDYIQQEAGNGANIIMGIGEDENLGDDISVTIIATGFPVDQQGLNGQDEKPIVHTLEEEPFNKEISISASKTTSTTEKEEVKKINPENLDEDVQEIFSENENNPEDENEMLDFKITTQISEIEDSTEPKNEVETKDEIKSIKTKSKSEGKQQLKSESQGFTLFTLEDDQEDENQVSFAVNQPNENKLDKAPKLESEPKFAETEVQETDLEDEVFDQPIAQNINEQIQERRERLKKFNYKFKSQLKDYSVDEIENIPAYKRNQVDLNEHSRNSSGGIIVDKDTSDDLKIRPNNFLHDNVD